VRLPVLRGTQQLGILWVTRAWPHDQRSSFSAALSTIGCEVGLSESHAHEDIQYFKYFLEAEKAGCSLLVYAV
jgi:hypothetical protein